MHGLHKVVFAILVFLAPAYAQSTFYQEVFTGARPGTRLASGQTYGYHQISWITSGSPGACQIEVDYSNDGMVWTTGGAVPVVDCRNSGASGVSGPDFFAYVRMNVTALTTASAVQATYYGSFANNNGGGGGANGVVNPCGVALAAAFYQVPGQTVTCDPNVNISGAGDLSALTFHLPARTTAFPLRAVMSFGNGNTKVIADPSAGGFTWGGMISYDSGSSYGETTGLPGRSALLHTPDRFKLVHDRIAARQQPPFGGNPINPNGADIGSFTPALDAFVDSYEDPTAVYSEEGAFDPTGASGSELWVAGFNVTSDGWCPLYGHSFGPSAAVMSMWTNNVHTDQMCADSSGLWINSGWFNHLVINPVSSLPSCTATNNGQIATIIGGAPQYCNGSAWAPMGTGGGAGTGTVTNFSAGNLAGLFTTSVANSTTSPALSFTFSTAPANTMLGNSTGAAAVPTWIPIPTGGGGGTGTVTSFSAGALSPLFTTNVATASTTPALSFVLSQAPANTMLGNSGASSAVPSWIPIPTPGGGGLAGCTTAVSGALVCNVSVQGGTGTVGELTLPYASTGLPTPPSTAVAAIAANNAGQLFWSPGNGTAFTAIGSGGGGGTGVATSLQFGSTVIPLESTPPAVGEYLTYDGTNIVSNALPGAAAVPIGGVTIVP